MNGEYSLWEDVLGTVLIVAVVLAFLSGCQSSAAGECTSLECLKDQERELAMRRCISENIDQAWDMEAIGMQGATASMIRQCRAWARKAVR